MNAFRTVRIPLLLGLGLACAVPALAQSAHRLGPQRINGYWILINHNVAVDVPNGGRNMNKPGCASVSYTIGSDGVPRDIKVEKVVPAGDFGQIAASAVANFRYGPSLTNRASEPVSTYYIVPFNSPDQGEGQQQLMAPCRLPGYDEG
ncbi:energy transducer TonB [Frateuria sp. Soil773]|uniref:energy transducer TonB n=1 Tax=Frateuria sp. Soil773 TaxID=1736407 RepID=UPI0007001C4A|nr:energy transducer TonB [Frateuria sp. Soil773]KRE99920.1 energy transducer TonB [Frateuria sp. Soil773]